MSEKIIPDGYKVEVVVKGLDGCPDELREIAVELEAKAAPAVPQGEPVAWMVWAGILDMRPVMTLFATKELAEAHARQIKSNTEVRPVPATPAAPSQPVTRPQNCGTSYCSCIECVCEPSQPVLDEDPDPVLSALMGMPVSRKVWGEFKAWQADKEAALREKGQV